MSSESGRRDDDDKECSVDGGGAERKVDDSPKEGRGVDREVIGHTSMNEERWWSICTFWR